MKKVAIIDYGAGNLKNVETALTENGMLGTITAKASDLNDADGLILPGVGAFADCMDQLQESGLIGVIEKNIQTGKPFLGICLGMQMLFDESDEGGVTKGLGLIPGRVEKMTVPTGMKLPHMGWNELVINREDPFLNGIEAGDYVYFVHSYRANPKEFDRDVLAYAEYAQKVPAVVRRDNVIGCQFHPEKSARAGAVFLNNLKEMMQ